MRAAIRCQRGISVGKAGVGLTARQMRRSTIAASSTFQMPNATKPAGVITHPGRATVASAPAKLTGPLAPKVSAASRSSPLPANTGDTSQVAAPKNAQPHISIPQAKDRGLLMVRAARRDAFAGSYRRVRSGTKVVCAT